MKLPFGHTLTLSGIERVLREGAPPAAPSGESLGTFGSLKREWPHLIAVFAIVMGVYWWSLPRMITLEDAGMFTMSCFFRGVSHPPGYPIHNYLGWLFTQMNLGTEMFEVSLLSSVCGALTCCVLWQILRMFRFSLTIAYVCALSCAVSELFWSQAVIPEVYTLHSLFTLIIIAQLLHIRETGSLGMTALCAFVFGLSIANHWPLVILSAPGFVLLVLPRWRMLLVHFWWLLLVVGLGMTPYIYMVARSHADPPVSFYGSIDGWKEFMFMFKRSGYDKNFTQTSDTWDDSLLYALEIFHRAAYQYLYVGGALAFAGLILQWRKAGKTITLGLLWASAGVTFLLWWRLSMDFDWIKRSLMRVFMIGGYCVFAIWIAYALQALQEYARGKSEAVARWVPRAALLLPVLILIGHSDRNYRANYDWAEDYGVTVLNSLEDNAILMVHDDIDTGTFGYLNLVRKIRPDVTMMNDQSLVFRERVAYSPNTMKARMAALGKFIDETDRPFYYTGNVEHKYGYEEYGYYKKVNKTLKPGQHVIKLDKDLVALFDREVEADTHKDMWTRHHKNFLIGRMAWVFAPWVAANSPESSKDFDAQADRLRNKVCSVYFGRLMAIKSVMNHKTPQEVLGATKDLESMADETVAKMTRADLSVIRGDCYYRLGDMKNAIREYKNSLDLYYHDLNPAVERLMQVYYELDYRVDYVRLASVFRSHADYEPRPRDPGLPPVVRP